MQKNKSSTAPAVHRVSLLGLLTLAACALAPLQPDLGAKAPRLDGFGRS